MIVLAGFTVSWMVKRDIIYTHGLGTGHMQTISSPLRTTLVVLKVHQGDHVVPGQVLAVVSSEGNESLLHDALEQLHRVHTTYDTLLSQIHAGRFHSKILTSPSRSP